MASQGRLWVPVDGPEGVATHADRRVIRVSRKPRLSIPGIDDENAPCESGVREARRALPNRQSGMNDTVSPCVRAGSRSV